MVAGESCSRRDGRCVMARYYIGRRSLLGTVIRWFFGFTVLAV
ncbi:hypothetical protein FMEAI12_4790002 [Parafrankia sp. Ea1.12]|nr:hypothetical protein FMEAI12_4790002 [Parafrankia sp. Ea1.12]